MREYRLNRKQKIARNLLLCGLLWLAVYAMLGFPPYTVRGMLDRIERRYFLSDLEPLLVERSSREYSYQFYKEHDTYLLARSGDTYLYTMYSRSLLRVLPEYGRNLKMGHGALCTARDGNIYVAGHFENAVSATAQVTAERTIQIYDPDTGTGQLTRGPEIRVFTLQGEKAGEELFTFRCRNGEHRDRFPEDLPETEWDLEDIANLWFRSYRSGEETDERSGYGLLYADLPVHVTLYDENGAVLDTLDLTIDTYELHSW